MNFSIVFYKTTFKVEVLGMLGYLLYHPKTSIPLFSRLKDEKLKSMNLMQHELCESPRCEECKKYYTKCTFREREDKIQEAFENL